MNVRIVRLKPTAQMPTYQSAGAAAADLYACIDTPVVLEPGERYIVSTGIALQLPEGYEAQVRARSGLSAKFGLTLANGIGTIDADYRGEVGVIVINLGDKAFTIEPNMRIAQMAVVEARQAAFVEVAALDETERGEGGYGSTGH